MTVFFSCGYSLDGFKVYQSLIDDPIALGLITNRDSVSDLRRVDRGTKRVQLPGLVLPLSFDTQV